jgi:hypothetical protein
VNCQTARETLELVRPDAPGAARVAEATHHVSGCASCRTAVRQREEVDVRIGELCRDVPIPRGLKERLLARLATRAPAGPAAAVPRIGSRRRWLGIVSLAAAAVMALGIGTWSLWPARLSVDLEEITGLMATDGINPANLTEFSTFAGGLAPQLPRTMRPLAGPPRRLGRFEAAVFFFKLGELDGRLAVVPRRFVKASDLPSATSLLSGFISYRPGGFCTTAWVEGDFVYVCCLSGAGLHQLAQPRSPPA